MPLYDYKCPACEERFEIHHSYSADAPPCPNCGHVGIQRIITQAPRISKGMNAHPGDGKNATKEQIQEKWAEETPKLRKKLVDKLGEDMVNKHAPTLNMKTGGEG